MTQVTFRNSLHAPRMVAVAGPLEGQTVALDTESFSIGRQSSNCLQLRDEAVSRRHCVMRRREAGMELSDLDSLGGTFVNGVPVQQRLIEDGDFIKVGSSLFLYLSRPIEGGDEPATAPRNSAGDYSLKSTIEVPAAVSLEFLSNRAPASEDRWAQQLKALLRISAEMQSLGGAESFLCRLAELALEIVPAERIAVLLADGDALVLSHMAAVAGATEEPQLNDALHQRVLSEKIAVMSNDLYRVEPSESAEPPRVDGVRGLLCAPLVSRDLALGVLYAETSRKDTLFGQEDLDLFAALAGIASPALENVQRWDRIEAENRRLRETEIDHDIVGESAVMEKILALVARVAVTDLPVLIAGESGSGKELVARAIHRNSQRAKHPFVAINCATLSENLLDSELFGHEKGAFTGAVERRLGQFELAHGGTLFLDEVGEIPIGLQARLLRALEEGEIRRLGGRGTIRVDIRLVAATNRDLPAEVDRGQFREDLYHRLNVFSLSLPPLRERGEDISLLASHFVARSAARLKRPVRGLDGAARKALGAYDWPGNVRELRNAMERAVVMAAGEFLRPEDLPEAVLECAVGKANPRTGKPAAGNPGNYHQAVVEAKRKILLAAVRAAGGHVPQAARNLGLNRTYLHRLLSRLDVRDEIEP